MLILAESHNGKFLSIFKLFIYLFIYSVDVMDALNKENEKHIQNYICNLKFSIIFLNICKVI